MADTLESLEIKVVHNASGADAEINGVATAIGRLKTALTGVPAALKELASAVKAVNDAFKGGTAKYDKFAESMLNVATSAESLGENSSHVMTLANAMNTLTSVKVTAGSFNALAKGVEGVGAAAQTITPEAISNLDKMVTSLAKLQGVDLQGLGSAMNAVRRGGSVTPKEPPIPVPDDLRELISNASAIDVLEAKLVSLRLAMEQAFNAGDVDKAYGIRNQILQTEAALEKARAAAEKTGKSAKGAADGIKKLLNAAKKSNSPLANFAASLKRIAFYRFLRTIIKEITQAFSEGLKNAYLFSQGIAGEGHRFAEALDLMKSRSTQMKNQLGSAFISLLAAIAPVLIRIIDLVTKAADAIAQFFAAFSGKGESYLKAVSVTDHFVDKMKAGGAAAKEWKNQLLGFDEINRLNEPSGGGGGGSLLDPSTMFEDSPINPKILQTVQFLKDNFETIKTLAIAIGLALAAWKIGSFISNLFTVGTHLGSILAIAFAIGGAFLFVKGACDAWENGVDWKNLAMMIGGCAIVALALGLAFGAVAAAVALVVGGIAMLVVGIHDWIKQGTLSTETFWLLEAAIAAVGVGLALIFGWPAAIAAAVAAMALAIYKYWSQIVQFFANIIAWINNILQGIGSMLQGFYDLEVWKGGRTGNEGDDGIDWSTIGFASGGFPNEGQLFYARESGPELVGTMGGRTAVANNQEITEGIRLAVYDAMMAANNGNGDVSVRVFLDSREIKAGQQRLNRAMGA